ncbi:DUF3306 domain-containing protein [Cupriavidus basilensis]|uniref:DUF3306 domain-containing protein n=1 Tax=Cupriavidus basilensis TaxID=68895 RepID=UPI0020A6C2E3|nr:DUF3306 domain-containing protein [Cupriavidus basilensis]MCP3022983.1 DUF3306 domain-containing protein [Cupriavidus basilensis]
MSDASFLSRWSRRKAAARDGKPLEAEPPLPAESSLPPGKDAPAARALPDPVPPAPPAEPLPTLADAALLQPGDSIARFVARGVDENVKRAALKTLFADPHFNVMDGLDTYIDDYSQPDPIPLDVLRRMRQSETLGLFAPTDEELAAARAQLEGAAVQDAALVPPEPSAALPQTAGEAAELSIATATDADADASLPPAVSPAGDSAPGKHA